MSGPCSASGTGEAFHIRVQNQEEDKKRYIYLFVYIPSNDISQKFTALVGWFKQRSGLSEILHSTN